MVRLQADDGKFQRGYLPNFTEEIFKVSGVRDKLPIIMYDCTWLLATCRQWDGTPIHGHFYPEELSLVKGDVFKIEKIIRRQVRQGVPSSYVKWEGFPAKYNSWVPTADIEEAT